MKTIILTASLFLGACGMFGETKPDEPVRRGKFTQAPEFAEDGVSKGRIALMDQAGKHVKWCGYPHGICEGNYKTCNSGPDKCPKIE